MKKLLKRFVTITFFIIAIVCLLITHPISKVAHYIVRLTSKSEYRMHRTLEKLVAWKDR
jgi:hypothetical protein